LTPEGVEIRQRLIAARPAHLSEMQMLRGFEPERHAELAAFIQRVAQQVVDEAPAS
jgi:hypothetical protein